MTFKQLYISFVLICLLFVEVSFAQTKPSNLHHIVILYADDLGWSDLECYDNRVHYTPNLNKLAAEGIRFTHSYAAAPICTASRASILTG